MSKSVSIFGRSIDDKNHPSISVHYTLVVVYNAVTAGFPGKYHPTGRSAVVKISTIDKGWSLKILT